ncbi:peptidase C1A, papain [Candidatus Vecturithrix granuli]|uniref:Peptidase C1A, papain n=1 Tax=Vecturithrix granuli TaxID=1499967 RepID=A0A081C531_VECG1|nr:peptidase C1A, papain [Candidatus Vecturithrix granuli]
MYHVLHSIMLKQARWLISKFLWSLLILVSGMAISLPSGYATTSEDENVQATSSRAENAEQRAAVDTYLLIHDTSRNMRRKKRIELMQNSMRTVIESLPESTNIGLRVFGHRFSLDGPDACEDTELVIPIEYVTNNREDFETQFNLLINPPLGGGAPVGLSLEKALDDLQGTSGLKEILLYMVDLELCRDPDPLETIRSVCQVDDSHLTLIGIGLKQDLRTLEDADINRLGCVDILNLVTPEDAEMLPQKLLTRFSLEFRNAEGQRVDPRPGDKLTMQLWQRNAEGKTTIVREKIKDATIRGSSLETIGLEDGAYLLDLLYEGQSLREKKELLVTANNQTREVIHLGKLRIDVTDSEGMLLENPAEQEVKITITDADKVIRTIDHLARAEFDLLPGSRYNVLISYNVGGERHTLKYQEDIMIREGNHQHLSVPLPIGALTGTVLNMQGDPADQVKMTLTRTGAIDESQTQEQAAVTDEQGQYLFVDVQSGVYTLTFEKAGYKRESQAVTVVGGKMTRLEDIRLFHGLEIQVAGVSGTLVDEAEITLTHRPSDTHIPVIRARTTYRNAQEIVPGTYVVTVHKPGYEPSSQTIVLKEGAAALDVSFSLPYYITVHGKIVDGKEDAVPDARVAFEHRHTTLLLPEGHQGIQVKPDGVFEAKLRVTGKGEEQLHLVWTDIYQQQYLRQIRFPLPQGPQVVALDQIRLPMNFLRLTLHDVIGQGIAADTIEVFHKQSGQSGILMSPEETGVYESTALVDGDYTIRVMKKGFQEVEDTVNVADGQVKHVALTLRNYITVVGTVVDGKQNRLSDASISFGEQNSTVMSLDPIVTGKDGRFQATLLVKQAKPEPITVRWTSPATERPYDFSTTFDLSAQPMTEFSPKDLGVYQLPANFVRLQIRDVSERGLPGVQVEFISSQGDITRGVELGDGLYESLDLPDGSYHITVMKPGYKEHAGVSDIAVGQNQRDVTLDPLRLPHYATVTGVILNGNDEGVPNVEISFEGKASEQLERCRTDQHGKFSTTLLITRAGDEHWRAYWKNKEFQVTGVFPLPLQPNAPAHFGEIHLPANFVTIPVNDIRGHALSDVEIEVLQQDGAAVGGEEFLLEASAPGVYQAKNLPDGVYTLSFHKEGYERGRAVTVTVMGGQHARLAPVRLGYYVTINGHAVNGAAVPVANALVTLQQTLCRVIPSTEQSPPASEPDTRYAHPPISTDREGNFSATVLVTSPGIETLTLTWNSDYAISREINLSQGPGTQHIDVRLPINFVGIHLTDIADRPLAEASILLTRQVDTAAFPLQEKEPGTYVSGELADGEYDILIQKDRYDTRTGKVHVRAGEVKNLVFQIQHYIVIKGHVIDGKKEGISAAVVAFEELKSEHRQKVISGTDGAFETQLLVKEIGKQRGVITYNGKHGTYAKEFWFELPTEPAQIALPRETTRLPINYITIEVKSVAATGVAGASVELIHQETGQRILARDNDHGNYEGVELPDGAYTILIRKDNYQAMQLESIRVANGEHKSNILAPKFSHYITMSGVVVNGKHQGVAGAMVAMVEPKRLQECDPFTTRADGSFTLHALVTDVGSETINVVWNEIYTTTLPVKLPSVPEHLRLDPIKLPINFIAVKVQDIYGNPLTGATVSFVKKQREASVGDALFVAPQTPDLYPAQEVEHGLYESPALPDHTYLVVVRKAGYVQKKYPEIPIRSGETVEDVLASLPHLITVSGNVTNGKGEGVTGVTVQFAQKNSQRSLYQLETDDQGEFSEQLLVTHPGKETLTLSKAYEFSPVRDHFTLSYDFPLRETPGQQRIDALRLPINFIPIQVQNVAGKGIDDADITVTLLQPEDPHANDEDQIAMASTTFHPLYLGEGRYEARNLTDGTYVIAINKKGYELQERIISVRSGEVATEALFVLPHYVVVKGQVVEGRGNGIANATLEFDPQHAQLLPFHLGDDSGQNVSPGVEQEIDQPVAIATGPNGEFIARLLVKSLGQQQVRASWNHRYARQFGFPLPEEPNPNFLLDEQITLPVNFAPFRVTDVLGQGMAGVEILVSRLEPENDAPTTVLAHPSGDGYYEAQELQDGTYTVIIRKAGYQEATSNFSVQGGERLQEQTIALPHYVTVQGTIVNSKGVGVAGATVTLAGMNSRVLAPEAPILTDAEGTFSLELLVTGAGSEELQEQMEVAWTDAESAAFLPQPNTFHISHPLQLSRTPGVMNLGLLTLPANFFSVVVRDIAGRGLSGVEVTFFDEQARAFPAKESAGGLYEGQNLPNGVYIVAVHKEGYQAMQQNDVRISSVDSTRTTSTPGTTTLAPITFELPYYIQIRGKTVNGKGESLTSRIDIALAGMHSQIVSETIAFDQQGTFEASVLVHAPGREQLDVHWQGDYGQHTVSVPFLLPEIPQVVDLQRLTLPVNFIPIEVRDLLGYGVTGARVTLTHLLSGQDIPAQELGDGQYEGSNLPDGAYQIAVVKEGYKAVDNLVASVSKGVVSDTKSFRLKHYVWITGNVTNGEGEGVRDPVIEVERLRSFETSMHSDMTGRFEVQLEVQEVGMERLFLTWNNVYRTPVTFLVPEKPEKKDLGDIRLPINFLSFLATDISGSTLPDVEVTVKEVASGRTQTYHTDLNGFCQTDDLPNGMYHVLVEKAGYRREAREVQVRDGESVALRFTLAHYVLVRGAVYDVLRHPVGEAEVIFEEFTDEKEQKLRTYTDAHTGRFEQRLLVNDATFLERQKGHVVVAKGETSQVLTFKIPATPNQVINYNGLLFPINYLDGKVVDAEIKTVPIEYAEISLTPLPEQPLVATGSPTFSEKETTTQETLHLTTDSLGRFEIGNLQQGEYKILIQKEGYLPHEDFIRISGLLQEQEFTLRKQ